MYQINHTTLSEAFGYNRSSCFDSIIKRMPYLPLCAVLSLHSFHIPLTSSHVSNIKSSYTLEETGVPFCSELGCIWTPCSGHDGLLRPRGATPESPWRSDPRSVTGLTLVDIGRNKGSHLILTSTLHRRTLSSGDEANVWIRILEKMCKLKQLTVWKSVVTTCATTIYIKNNRAFYSNNKHELFLQKALIYRSLYWRQKCFPWSETSALKILKPALISSLKKMCFVLEEIVYFEN
jgi:hypothetical protein